LRSNRRSGLHDSFQAPHFDRHGFPRSRHLSIVPELMPVIAIEVVDVAWLFLGAIAVDAEEAFTEVEETTHAVVGRPGVLQSVNGGGYGLAILDAHVVFIGFVGAAAEDGVAEAVILGTFFLPEVAHGFAALGTELPRGVVADGP